jgi:hypothetical protein
METPSERSRMFDKFFSVYRNWTTEVLSLTNLIQTTFELGVGSFWNKIVFEIYRKYGPEAADSHKISILEHRNTSRQSIFHSLAKCFNSSHLWQRNEALQLFWTLQIDPLWFGPPLALNSTSFQWSFSSQVTQKQIYSQIRSALRFAMSQADINGKSPQDLIIDPFLKSLWVLLTIQYIPGLHPNSLTWKTSEEVLNPELIHKLKELTPK